MTALATKPDPDMLAEVAVRAARADLASFIRLFHHEYEATPYHAALARDMTDVVQRTIDRLVLACPPQTGKSHTATHAMAWSLGRNPASKNILVSYSAELVRTFARRIREILRSPTFAAIFPECELTADAQSLENMTTTAGGALVCQGVGGSLTGHAVSPDGLCLCDDLVSGREAAQSRAQMNTLREWWDSVMRTRIHPGAGIILAGTRWGNSDVHAHVKLTAPDAWTWRTYPALDDRGRSVWPNRYPAEYYENLRDELDDFTWRCMYMCEPIVTSENSVDPACWQWLDPDRIPNGTRFAWGVDLATTTKTTSDFTAMVRVGITPNKSLVIGPGWFTRLPWMRSRERIIATIHAQEKVEGPVAVEAVGGFKACAEDLKEALAGKAMVRSINATTDKVSRSLPWLSIVEAGRAYLLEMPAFKPFATELIAQAQSFGAGQSHDDTVDAVQLAHAAASAPQGRIVPWFDNPKRADPDRFPDLRTTSARM